MEDVLKLKNKIAKQGFKISKLKKEKETMINSSGDLKHYLEKISQLELSEKELIIENQELIQENEELKQEISELIIIVSGVSNIGVKND